MPCRSGKIDHLTRDVALEHLKSLVWQNHSRGESEKSRGLNVYPCDECGAWHVGHGDSGPIVYHYTLMRHLDAIVESGVLRARRPRVIDKRALRGLSKQQREAVMAMDEPAPLLWFSRNPDWEYSVIKALIPKQGKRIGGVFAAGEITLTRRSDLEINCGGLLRFVVPAWCAKLRWSDYLARNPTPSWLRDGMAMSGNPTEWLCTDEDVPLERVRDIQAYFSGEWTPVANVADEDFDAYLAARPAAYEDARLRLNAIMSRIVETNDAADVKLSEPERVLLEDWKHTRDKTAAPHGTSAR